MRSIKEKFEDITLLLFFIAGIVFFIAGTIASIHYIDRYIFMDRANEYKCTLLDKQWKVIQEGDSIILSNELKTEKYDSLFVDMEECLMKQL